jgi:hypothetical protein
LWQKNEAKVDNNIDKTCRRRRRLHFFDIMQFVDKTFDSNENFFAAQCDQIF